MTCRRCGAPLGGDEIGMHKKLVNRGDTTFMCLSCLAAEFCCSKALLQEKIEQYRASGCTLFAPGAQGKEE